MKNDIRILMSEFLAWKRSELQQNGPDNSSSGRTSERDLGLTSYMFITWEINVWRLS